jgi:hypothetical protein
VALRSEPQHPACHACTAEEALLLKAMAQMYSAMERGLQHLSHAAITVEVYMLDGSVFTVQVCAMGTLADLCDAIEAKKGYAPHLQELMVDGREESLPGPKISMKKQGFAGGFGFSSPIGDFETKLLMSFGIQQHTQLLLRVTSSLGAVQRALDLYLEKFTALQQRMEGSPSP